MQFTRSGGVDIAYQVLGEGDLDILFMVGWVSNLEVMWELPEARHLLARLAAMGRVAIFDKRGTGLSDRPIEIPSATEMVPDVIAVMDAVGMKQAAVIGWVDSATLALEVAAAHPDRVSSLVLGETLATATADESHPWGLSGDIIETAATAIESGGWGQALLLPMLAPSVAGDERISAWFRKLERMSATPTLAANLLRRLSGTDVRPLLSRVTAPTLVVHRRDSTLVPADGVRWLAENLPNGRYVEPPGNEIPGQFGDTDALMDELEEFLVGTRTGATGDRRLLTLMFSDVAGSTERAAIEGDRRWHDLLEFHRRDVRDVVAIHGGREVDTAGDGFLIAFDAASSAIRCAQAVSRSSQAAGLHVRIGIHSGELVDNGGALSGIALHIGARVGALAGPDEVLVSRTVRDMMIGTSFEFEDRGRHVLKGVPGEWEIFAVLGR